jgi:H+-transporting ATPase
LANTAPFALMLLVASVPVALPSMFTMSAALGARGLAAKGILATRLSAVEDAAVMDVLLLDKTGTITENRLAIQQTEPYASTTEGDLLRLAALASDEATQDPLDLAVIEAARKRGLLEKQPPRLSFEPFDPATRRSEVRVREDDQVVRIIKGEPATVAELANTPWSDITDQVARLSSDGSRVLAVASGADSELRFRGLIAFADPPREDSAALISELMKQGVRVVLVTGDGEATARAIAAKVGIHGEVAPAGTIHEGFDPEAATRFSVFPAVYPNEKFLLVQALQQAGHVVGMTGDGVNDAPALGQADVGIAVSSATDVAKAAASLVLTRPGLAEIVMAVQGSRTIYQRMQTWVIAMITRKASIPPFLALGLLVFGAFVLNPLLIVLFMLLGDIATFALAWDRVVPSPKPNRWIVSALAVTGSGLAVLLLVMSGAVFCLVRQGRARYERLGGPDADLCLAGHRRGPGSPLRGARSGSLLVQAVAGPRAAARIGLRHCPGNAHGEPWLADDRHPAVVHRRAAAVRTGLPGAGRWDQSPDLQGDAARVKQAQQQRS